MCILILLCRQEARELQLQPSENRVSTPSDDIPDHIKRLLNETNCLVKNSVAFLFMFTHEVNFELLKLTIAGANLMKQEDIIKTIVS